MNNKEATALRSESMGVGRLIGYIIGTIIGYIFIGIITALIALIPILGWILAIIIGIFVFLSWISVILDIIGLIRSKATLTECGIYGNSFRFGTFDLTFDQISSINYGKGMITVKCLNGGKKNQIKIYGIANAKDFYNACNEQMAKAQAAPAEAAAEAEA